MNYSRTTYLDTNELDLRVAKSVEEAVLNYSHHIDLNINEPDLRWAK